MSTKLNIKEVSYYGEYSTEYFLTEEDRSLYYQTLDPGVTYRFDITLSEAFEDSYRLGKERIKIHFSWDEKSKIDAEVNLYSGIQEAPHSVWFSDNEHFCQSLEEAANLCERIRKNICLT